MDYWKLCKLLSELSYQVQNTNSFLLLLLLRKKIWIQNEKFEFKMKNKNSTKYIKLNSVLFYPPLVQSTRTLLYTNIYNYTNISYDIHEIFWNCEDVNNLENQ